MTHTKPDPLLRQSAPRKRCPVCGEPSYSQAGQHPQCSMQRSEKARLARVERQEFATESPSPDHKLRRWDKQCPRCGMHVHVRKRACACGHDFARPND